MNRFLVKMISNEGTLRETTYVACDIASIVRNDGKAIEVRWKEHGEHLFHRIPFPHLRDDGKLVNEVVIEGMGVDGRTIDRSVFNPSQICQYCCGELKLDCLKSGRPDIRDKIGDIKAINDPAKRRLSALALHDKLSVWSHAFDPKNSALEKNDRHTRLRWNGRELKLHPMPSTMERLTTHYLEYIYEGYLKIDDSGMLSNPGTEFNLWPDDVVHVINDLDASIFVLTPDAMERNADGSDVFYTRDGYYLVNVDTGMSVGEIVEYVKNDIIGDQKQLMEEYHQVMAILNNIIKEDRGVTN